MASDKNLVVQLLNQCKYLLGAIGKIQDDTGFGTVQFEVKCGRVAFRHYTVREHPSDD